MINLNFISEFHLNIEDVTVTILCDNPPDGGINNEGGTAPIHAHAFFELFNVRKGSLEVHFEAESITISENSMIIIPPLVNHVCIKSPDADIDAIDFSFISNKLRSDYPLYEKMTSLFKEPYFLICNCDELVNLTGRLHICIEAGDFAYMSMYFHELLLHIFNTYNENKHDISKAFTTDSNFKRLYKIQQLVSRGFSQEITLEDIAESLYLSPRQVTRIIKQRFNCTFKEYLTKTRMDVASHLLITTNAPVSHIFSSVGYNSLQSFYEAFKKYFGCTPVEYREKNQKM